MGLLRQPTTSGIVEDGTIGPALRAGAHETNLRLRRHSQIASGL